MNTWSKIGVMIDTVEQVNSDYRRGTQSRIIRESLIGRIISILFEGNNGIPAALIANRLGVSKSLVNSILYKMKEFDICNVDSNFNWWLA